MYDKYPSLQRLDKQDFGFLPTRYEIWKAGQITESGKTNMPIVAKVLQEDGKDIVGVMFVDPKLNNEIAPQQYYDDFVTSADRLMLLTVPQQTNAENTMAIQMFKMTIGTTRAFKNFSANEAYCCNLFTIDGNIEKITFSFSNPEKLIEFYNDGNKTEEENEEEDFENVDLSIEFESADHIRYENGNHVSGPHGGARRMVKIATDRTQDNVHIVTLYNIDGDHPVWQNNMQMAPKQMQIIEMEDDKTVLRGFGTDSMGNTFDDYGMSLIYDDDILAKCILHMHDRGVDIEYLKEVGKKEGTKLTKKDIALALLHFLIEEHEDGDALVLQSTFESVLQEKIGISASLEEMSKAVEFINSFYNRPIIIEQWVPSGGILSMSRETGFYTEMTKGFLRDTIETIN